jgi:proliferating cell nuclear antigen
MKKYHEFLIEILMLEARLTQSGQFKKIVEAIKDIVTDINFDCNSNGISVQAIDASHVSLVSLVLRSEGFESYQCDNPISLGINLSSLYKILKCSSSEDSITISCGDDPESLSITFESQEKDRSSQFHLRLIQIDPEQLGIPDTEYNATICLTSVEYRRICTDMSTLGDTMDIAVSKEGLKFEIDGDIGKGSITLHQPLKETSIDENIKLGISEPVKMTFALRHLNSFAKATPLSDKIIIRMSKDVPLQLHFKIYNLGFIRYYLAPKENESN